MKHTLSLIAVLFVFAFAKAQKQDRVKGNREPSVMVTDIEPFQSIELDSDWEVELMPGEIASVEINADSNLHQYLEPSSTNGVFRMGTLAEIRSSKKLEIRITYTDELTSIILRDKAEAKSVTKLEIENLDLTLEGDARAYLTIRGESFHLVAGGGTRSKLDVKTDASLLEIYSNANVEAQVNGDEMDLRMSNRCDVKLEGNVNEVTASLKDSAELESKKLTIQRLAISLLNKANATVDVDETIDLKAENDAKLYVHNNPAITLSVFKDKAMIKKE